MNNIYLNKALENYIIDPKYPLYNFELGRCYENLNQNASALSFYLRTAELSTDELLSYESVIRIALCIEKVGNRVHSLKGVVLRAISLMPKRPEAYFVMSRICEQNKEWHDGYAFATIGESIFTENDSFEQLKTDVGYPGRWVFVFEKAVTAWWIGLYDESIHLFRQLDKRNNMPQMYKTSIQRNIRDYGYLWKHELRYNDSMYHELRMKFSGAINIKENYSQCFQDIFVLMMTKGKTSGSYLEIGCGDPWFSNNTALLWKQFKWLGLSMDINQDKVNKFSNERTGALCDDATKFDFITTLKSMDKIDYLQIDCDPAIISFQVLQRIPFETTKFAVITFEHDNFCDEHKEIKERSRKYLESFGYVMVVNNISEDRFSDFEDWWVHPDLVDKQLIERMKCISDKPKRADNYIYGRI